jgi:hypothetical protein
VSIRDARYLQHVSADGRLSEVDLWKVIGISDEGHLVFGGSGFWSAVDARSMMLVNGHTLLARIDGILRGLDLNERIQSVDGVLKYTEKECPAGCLCCFSLYGEDVDSARCAAIRKAQQPSFAIRTLKILLIAFQTLLKILLISFLYLYFFIILIKAAFRKT